MLFPVKVYGAKAQIRLAWARESYQSYGRIQVITLAACTLWSDTHNVIMGPCRARREDETLLYPDIYNPNSHQAVVSGHLQFDIVDGHIMAFGWEISVRFGGEAKAKRWECPSPPSMELVGNQSGLVHDGKDCFAKVDTIV